MRPVEAAREGNEAECRGLGAAAWRAAGNSYKKIQPVARRGMRRLLAGECGAVPAVLS
jgi:hypothetical protein